VGNANYSAQENDILFKKAEQEARHFGTGVYRILNSKMLRIRKNLG